jgi:hypothetical protein
MVPHVAPPVTYSTVLEAEGVVVRLALTTCAAPVPRSMLTARMILAEGLSIAAAGLADRAAGRGVAGVGGGGAMASIVAR